MLVPATLCFFVQRNLFGDGAFGFLWYQSSRGLEIGSMYTSVLLLLRQVGVPCRDRIRVWGMCPQVPTGDSLVLRVVRHRTCLLGNRRSFDLRERSCSGLKPISVRGAIA